MILGRPFFNNHGVNIDFKNRCLSFTPICQLISIDNINLAPGQTALVKAKCINSSLPDGLNGMIESQKRRSGLEIIPIIATVCDNKTPCLLTNKTDRQITLKRGKHISTFQPLNSNHCPLQRDKPAEAISNITTSTPPSVWKREMKKELQKEYGINLAHTALDEGGQKKLQQVLYDNREAFVDSSGKIGYNDWVPHRIHMKENTAPYAKQPYRMSPEIKAALGKQIQSLLDQQVIVEADTPWCAPVVPVRKGISKTRKHLADPSKKPDIRLCIDFSICKCKFPAQPGPYSECTGHHGCSGSSETTMVHQLGSF